MASDATSHWSLSDACRINTRPCTGSVGRRYVEDWDGLPPCRCHLGIQGAWHLVAELAGPAEAQTGRRPAPRARLDPDRGDDHRQGPLRGSRLAVGLNYLEPWFRPTVGIALRDGVGELDATAAFEVYGQSAAAQRSRSQPVTRSAPGTASSCSPPRSRRRPASLGSSCPAQAHPAPSTRDCAPGPSIGTCPSNRSRAGLVRTGLAAAGSPLRCRTSPTTPTPAPLARPRKWSAIPPPSSTSALRTVLAPVPARPRQPRGRNPPRREPGLPQATSSSPA